MSLASLKSRARYEKFTQPGRNSLGVPRRRVGAPRTLPALNGQDLPSFG